MLGKVDSIGKFYVFDGGLKPGAGVGKELDAVGDYSITGVVNVGGFYHNKCFNTLNSLLF